MDDEDDQLMETAGRDPYGALGLDDDPEVAFAGVRAQRQLAEFCERYQVRRLREAGHSWARIAALAGVSPQALHKKHAHAMIATDNPSNQLSYHVDGEPHPGHQQLRYPSDPAMEGIPGGAIRRTRFWDRSPVGDRPIWVGLLVTPVVIVERRSQLRSRGADSAVPRPGRCLIATSRRSGRPACQTAPTS